MQEGPAGTIGTLHQLVQRSVREFWLSGSSTDQAGHIEIVFRAVRQMLVAKFKSSDNPRDWRLLDQLAPCVDHWHQRVMGADPAVLEIGQADLELLGQLGMHFHYQGQHKDALKLQLEVVEFRERVLGAEHPDTALSKGDLAATYGALGQHQDALKLELEVVEFNERVLGGEHPDTATSKAQRPSTYYHLGQLPLAEEHFRGAVSIGINCLPPLHPALQNYQSGLKRLQAAMKIGTKNGPKPKKFKPNAPCPCGSGKKHKKCKREQYH
jgi:tetratricopeptide (TPR) repeat protein